jgi:predicted ATPase
MYVDNFRCLVNFEIRFDRMNLLLGPNGSGKSSVFEVLRRIQRLINEQESIDDLFPTENLTRWQTLKTQRFEVDFEVGVDSYRYVLIIEHTPDLRKRRIQEERLTFNHEPLFEFLEGTAKLYRDNRSKGPEYPFDWTRSGVAMLQERPDNSKLIRFRQGFGRIVIARVLPSLINATSFNDQSRLDSDATNFASWYRFLSQEHQGNIVDLTQTLRSVMPGFDSFSLREHGEDARVLSVFMRAGSQNEKSVRYSFEELSDGQRMLVVLYALLNGLKGKGFSLFLDEPDNFLSLREIQPWLLALQDACGSDIDQATLISHHPEAMNLLAHSNGRWFTRPENGPVRLSEPPPDAQNLSASEIVARGWNS